MAITKLGEQVTITKLGERVSGTTKYSRYEYFVNIEESGKPLKKVSQKRKAVENNRKAVEES